MRDADVHTLHAPRTEMHTLTPRRVPVTRENALVRIMLMAGCDLDQGFRERYKVSAIPGLVRLPRGDFADRSDALETEKIYAAGLISAPQPTQPLRATVSEIRDAIAERIEHDWSQCVLIAPALAHSKAFDLAVQAAQQVSVVVNRLRKSSVVPLPFQLAVIESGTFSAGAGVLAFDAVARSHVGLFGDRLTYHLEGMRKLVHTFVALKDYSYLETDRAQITSNVWTFSSKLVGAFGFTPVAYVNYGQASVDKRVKGYEARVNHLLQRCIDGIRSGLKTPAVCVSYAGSVRDLPKFASWPLLVAAAQERRVRVIASPMSLTEAVRLGPGSIVGAFASSNFRP